MGNLNYKTVTGWLVPALISIAIFILNDMRSGIDKNTTVINEMKLDVAIIKFKVGQGESNNAPIDFDGILSLSTQKKGFGYDQITPFH